MSEEAGNPEAEQAAQKIVTEAFALVGAVTMGFATIEFHLQFLLSVLISGHELAPEAMLALRAKQFAQRIDLLRDLVILRLPKDTELRQRGTELLAGLDALRITRNHYIHGYWLINYPLIVSTGGVRCSETKLRFDKAQETWTTMQTEDIPLDALRQQITDTGNVFNQIHALIRLIQERFAKSSTAAKEAPTLAPTGSTPSAAE